MAERRRGFWMGLVVGLGLGAAGAVALAILNPLETLPPELEATALEPPAEAPAPTPAAPLRPPAPQALIRGDAPAPLISARPAAELPPDLPGLAPPASDAFRDGPSLFPGNGVGR